MQLFTSAVYLLSFTPAAAFAYNPKGQHLPVQVHPPTGVPPNPFKLTTGKNQPDAKTIQLAMVAAHLLLKKDQQKKNHGHKPADHHTGSHQPPAGHHNGHHRRDAGGSFEVKPDIFTPVTGSLTGHGPKVGPHHKVWPDVIQQDPLVHKTHDGTNPHPPDTEFKDCRVFNAPNNCDPTLTVSYCCGDKKKYPNILTQRVPVILQTDTNGWPTDLTCGSRNNPKLGKVHCGAPPSVPVHAITAREAEDSVEVKPDIFTPLTGSITGHGPALGPHDKVWSWVIQESPPTQKKNHHGKNPNPPQPEMKDCKVFNAPKLCSQDLRVSYCCGEKSKYPKILTTHVQVTLQNDTNGWPTEYTCGSRDNPNLGLVYCGKGIGDTNTPELPGHKHPV